MEERLSGNSQTEEIEGLQFRLETGTHLTSLVVTEEVCVCLLHFSQSESNTSKLVQLKQFVFISKDTI